MSMRRLNFHLTDEQIERLYHVAAQRNISAGELVRRFIDQGLARLGAPTDLWEGSDLAAFQRQIADMREDIRALESRLAGQDQHTLS